MNIVVITACAAAAFFGYKRANSRLRPAMTELIAHMTATGLPVLVYPRGRSGRNSAFMLLMMKGSRVILCSNTLNPTSVSTPSELGDAVMEHFGHRAHLRVMLWNHVHRRTLVGIQNTMVPDTLDSVAGKHLFHAYRALLALGVELPEMPPVFAGAGVCSAFAERLRHVLREVVCKNE
jgi:hypothetical protein